MPPDDVLIQCERCIDLVLELEGTHGHLVMARQGINRSQPRHFVRIVGGQLDSMLTGGEALVNDRFSGKDLEFDLVATDVFNRCNIKVGYPAPPVEYQAMGEPITVMSEIIRQK